MQAYKKESANKGSAGVDDMGWTYLEQNLDAQLYKLWNRLSSGSYFPAPVKEVEIQKDGGNGVRKLGIPTILDRIAQCVVKTHLEQIVEPHFHNSSYGLPSGKKLSRCSREGHTKCDDQRLGDRP